MTTPHTPEPWVVQGTTVHHLLFQEPLDGRNEICRVPNNNPEGLRNADRIVACVNACDGLNPAAVPDLRTALQALLAVLDRRTTSGLAVNQVLPKKISALFYNPCIAARCALAKAAQSERSPSAPIAHTFHVHITGCTRGQAERVLRERLGHDEDYGFDYQLNF